ncbi:MAG: hypothetical protein ACFCVG_07365 [Kineosporiaceae bacterium]
MRARWPAGVAVVVVVLGLVSGAAAARAVDGFLAVDFRDRTALAGEPPGVPTAAAGAPADEPRAVTLRLPPGSDGDPLLSLAAAGFAAADGDPLEVTAALDPASGLSAEGHRTAVTGDAAVTVTASDRRGLAQGLFRLADLTALGATDEQLRAAAGTREPAADVRLLDFGAAGVPVDRAAYAAQDDYSHVQGFLADALLAGEPWLDPDAMAEVERTWREHVDHAARYGYNGVVVPGFLEYVTFSGVGDGDAVYPPGTAHRERAVAMRRGTAPLWDYAEDMGLSVVMSTDMLALTSPLESYLREGTGGLDPSDPQLWEVYRAGVDELLSEVPAVDGLMIRIGEAGGIYNTAGWDYYSRLAVTAPADVQAMLDALTAAAAPHDAEIVFRTWSVGVGEVGDLHTNPDTYDRVVGPADAPNLVVSTKLVAGDFDAFLPLNPTLLTGDQRRIMEVQARREFEAFSAFPNVVSGDTQAALRQVREETGRLPGLWVWSQSGGPQRAGPMTLYLREGFWQLYDLDVWLSARLAWDPDTDLGVETATWLRRTWTDDPAAVRALGELLEVSRGVTLDGLYVGPYAEQEVRAFGLEPPPMMWIFKWDLVSGDSASWAAVYTASRGRVDEAVAEADAAVAGVDRMIGVLDGVDRAAFRDPVQYDALAASLEYERDLFATLGDWRETALRYHEWADTGSPEALAAYRAAADRYERESAAHAARWEGNVALPPYEFGFADTGLAQMRATTAATWTARAALMAALAGLLLVPALRRAALTPWQLGPGAWQALDRWQRAPVLLVPLAVLVAGQAAFSGYGSATYLALGVGLPVLGAVALVAAVRLAAGAPAAGTAAVAACGAHLVGAAVLPAAVAWRGHLAAWYGFWVEPAGRTVFVVAAVTGLVWLVAGPVLALTGARAGAVRASAARILAPAAGALGAIGAPLLLLGVVVGRAGTERFLTALNDELVVLPNGLSRILGITVHLGIPQDLDAGLVSAGGGLLAAGVVLAAAAAAVRSGRTPGRGRGTPGSAGPAARPAPATAAPAR